MIGGITSFLTNPTLTNVAQSTTSSLTIETMMKAIGRPSFILADNKIENDTKKYAVTKEFLYQMICLVTYMALVIPVFEKGGFKFAKNHLMKDEKMFQLFKDRENYLSYRKLAEMAKETRIKNLESEKYKDTFSRELTENLKNNDKPEKYPLIKGTLELINLVGSVLGLAILAPQVSHFTVHPIMKAVGMEKENA